MSLYPKHFMMNLCVIIFFLQSFASISAQNIDLNLVANLLNILNISDVTSSLFLLQNVMANYQVPKPNNECEKQLQYFMEGLQNGEFWALQMFDSSAKPQTGILTGNTMHFGNYDECITIHQTKEDSVIAGKYCNPQLKRNPKYTENEEGIFSFLNVADNSSNEFDMFEIRKSYALCLPKACNAKEIQPIIESVEDLLQSPIHLHFSDTLCTSGELPPWSTAAICALMIFGIFGFLMIVSTIYDLMVYQMKPGGNKAMIAFSAYTNFKKIMSPKTGDDTMKCLNGLRVISMLWILLAHRFLYLFFIPAVNTFQIEEWKSKWYSNLILGATMAVDTFFTISGFLVVYLFMKSRDKGAKFSLPMFYIHRILRLSPSLIMVVLFSATLQKYIGSGPYWDLIYEMLQKPCEKSWWVTILYLQNYITEDQCLSQAWYLAVDTQLYFLSPFFLFPLLKWPKRTIATMIVAMILCTFYVFEISWKRDLILIFFQQTDEQFNTLYVPTHVRFPPYFIGAIFGYYAYKKRTVPLKLRKIIVILLWIASLTVMIVIIGAHSTFSGTNFTVFESSLFNSMERPCWALALCIIIMLCINNYGGIINKFLSHPIFTVLIRLNYNMYLLHMIVISFFAGRIRTPTYFDTLVGYYTVWGDYMYTMFVAIIWTLAFESPILALEKIFFAPRLKQNGNQRNDNNVTISVRVGQDSNTELPDKVQLN